jgi:hypothetical protein
MAEPATVTVTFTGLPPEEAAGLTRGLVQALSGAGAPARIAEGPGGEGQRAVELDLTSIVLTIATHSAAHLCAEYIKGYLARHVRAGLLIRAAARHGHGDAPAAGDEPLPPEASVEAVTEALARHLPPK